MLSKLKHLGQAGDTIVEVMVVLAVLGMAIGISYAVASRSLMNVRQAQETSTATELLQSQIEYLRQNAGAPTSSPVYIYDSTQSYCFNSAFNPVKQYVSAAGSPCNKVNGLYDISITFDPTMPFNPTYGFNLVAAWPDVTGLGTDQVKLNYRVHQ